MESRWVKISSLVLLAIALYFTCFHHLLRLPMNLWDESLFFFRAYNFLQQGSYLENFNLYDYGIDHRNTKLPFTTLSQVLSLKLLGVSTLAMRLPIALIFITTVLYSLRYFQKEFKNYGIGIAAALVMVGSQGWVRDHMLRTGDHDVPYACYVLLAVLFFYRFEKSRKTRDLGLFTFWVLGALLTKNLLIGLLVPGLLLYLLYKRSLAELLKDTRSYVALGVLIGTYTLLVFYYESRFPGFFDRMWNYELLGRYTTTIDGHGQDHFYFLKGMMSIDFVPFIYIIPIAILALMILKTYRGYRDLAVLVIFVFVTYFLGISLSSTRVFWYAAPLYPLGAIILSLALLPPPDTQPQFVKGYLPLLLLVLFSFPIYKVVLANNNPQTIYQSSKLGSFLENLKKDKPQLKEFSFYDNSFGTGAGFYIEQAKEAGYKINYKRKANFRVGEYVSLCRHKLVPKMKEQYSLTKTYADKDCVVYLLGERE